MKASDRGIIVGIGVIVLAVLFYMAVLGPKRNQASELGSKIDSLNSSISQQRQVASFGEEARRSFPRYYGRLVVLGKAVPAAADTSSMLVQLNSTADRAGVEFRGITLSQGATGSGSSTASPSPAPTSSSSTSSSSTSSSSTSASGSTGTSTTSAPASSAPSSSSTTAQSAPASSTGAAVPATEADAASQPIGAVVGPGGYSTMPYDLTFKGGFFDVSNFIGGLDSLVKPRGSGVQVAANGRLFTVNGFTLSIGAGGPEHLDANFLVTSYVSPQDQGLTAGASPQGPAPAVPGEAQAVPASATVAQ
jgi:hypothetical protein